MTTPNAGKSQNREKNPDADKTPKETSEAIIAVSLTLTGSSAVSMLAMLAIPIVTLSARFSSRGILIGVATVLGLMIAVALGTNAGAVAHDPPLLIAPLAVVVSIAMLSVALMNSDVEHRSKAVIDQLTGLLNRTGTPAAMRC